MTIDDMERAVDPARLEALLGRIIGDLGGVISVPLVRVGDGLGLYRHLHEGVALTAEELAERSGVAQRYVAEWFAGQAASGYVTYDAELTRFGLSPEQAIVFAQDDSPVDLRGAFDRAAAMGDNTGAVMEAFRTGEGVAGGTRRAACSAPWAGSSARNASIFSSRTGCPRSTASPSAPRAAAWWRISAAGPVTRPCSWRRPFPRRA